jgi:hypothetical protein
MTRRRLHFAVGLMVFGCMTGIPTKSSAHPPEEPAKCPVVEAEQQAAPCDCDCRRDGIQVTDYKNLVLYNAGSLLGGRIEFEYVRALHPRVSIFGVMYALAFDSVFNQSLVGFGARVGARGYMFGAAPEGLWASWDIGGIYRRARGDDRINIAGLETGGTVGYTGVWGRFALSLGVGAYFLLNRLKVQDASVKDSEWNPRVRFALGVAF